MIVVIGGGLAGLATARSLQQDGHDVLVLEAREDVGLETSFANGGMLTPSLPEPWNGPGIGRALLASLMNPRAPLRLGLRSLPSLAGWGSRFVLNSTARRYVDSTLANYRLCADSRRHTADAVRAGGIDCDLEESGTLCIYRDAAELAGRWALCERLVALGLTAERVPAGSLPDIEPALEPGVAAGYCGGIWLPDDARGDARRFCAGLAALIRADGGEIRTDCAVSKLLVTGGRVAGVATSSGTEPAERVVVAAGVRSPALLAATGRKLPIRPAKGYSLTFEMEDATGLPAASLVDESAHVVAGRFGSRVRAVGFAEFTGFDRSIDARRIAQLFESLRTLLPAVAARLDPRDGARWAGLRPMSVDGRPYIGATGIAGLYVNAGHGALGWTMAMGSGALVADLLAGREPAVDAAPFRPDR